MITAEEFLKENNLIKMFNTGNPFISDIMIKFAQLHVEAALRAANLEASKFVDDNEEECYKPQIINAYPKELIK